MSDKIRVALADDHPIVLAGLRNLIEAEADLELVGEASSGQSARKLIRDRLPDVAVIDVSMPEINGITLARRLAEDCPGVRVIILTLYEERSFLKQALAAGSERLCAQAFGGGKSGVRHTGRAVRRDLCRSPAWR